MKVLWVIFFRCIRIHDTRRWHYIRFWPQLLAAHILLFPQPLFFKQVKIHWNDIFIIFNIFFFSIVWRLSEKVRFSYGGWKLIHNSQMRVYRDFSIIYIYIYIYIYNIYICEYIYVWVHKDLESICPSIQWQIDRRINYCWMYQFPSN